jgi:pyruvate dehydrogenase E2 component (dihydrolipoamide acetyltransferase)
MPKEIILPKLGQTMEEGVIVEWLKKEGDPVARGDVLFQVESDKAVLEVESKIKGVLLKILVDKGLKVPVLTVVGLIGEPGEAIASPNESATTQPTEDKASPPARPALATAQPGRTIGSATASGAELAPGEGRVFISPRARKLAQERGLDYTQLTGSGPGGRIIERDVQAFLDSQPAATPLAVKVAREMGVHLSQATADATRLRAADVAAPAAPALQLLAAPAMPSAEGAVAPLSGLRAIIAERMAHSSQTTAAVTLQSVVDATELVALRERLKTALDKELGFSIGYNDLLAVIVARCLVEHPYMNVRLEAGGIRQLPDVNLGLAVDSERGLLVPVVHGAQHLLLRDFAIRFRDLVARARVGKALPDELTGGTLTITNLGMVGVDMFTPIINLPECAILGVGRIRPEPAVVDGQVAVRQRMWLSLTFDHRLVDGAPAARFLQAIMRYVEAPYLLLA